MHKWYLIDKWKNKRQGQVWRVKDNNGRNGYFKFAYDKQWYDAGPIVGNEWLARQLALLLGLPCADVEQGILLDQGHSLQGIVSLPRPQTKLVSWNGLPDASKSHAEETIDRIALLMGTIAFDVWLTNIDRGSGENIIFYKKENGKWRWYLIDHGYSLYGCPRKWKGHAPSSEHWLRVWRFYHIPQGWKRLATRERLQGMASKIAKISPSTIRQLVHQVPDPQYSQAVKRATIQLLLRRQKQLPSILDAWLRYPGNKESTLR